MNFSKNILKHFMDFFDYTCTYRKKKLQIPSIQVQEHLDPTLLLITKHKPGRFLHTNNYQGRKEQKEQFQLQEKHKRLRISSKRSMAVVEAYTVTATERSQWTGCHNWNVHHLLYHYVFKNTALYEYVANNNFFTEFCNKNTYFVWME